MADSMWEIGLMIKCKATDSLVGQEAKFTKACTKKISNMAKELWFLKMAPSMMGIG
jgi:hypothetical protein